MNTFCKTTFKKIRVNKNYKRKTLTPFLSNLINKRNLLVRQSKKKTCSSNLDNQIKILNKKISFEEALLKRNTLLNFYTKFASDPEKINLSEMWKYLNIVSPKFNSPLPQAKINHLGRLISSPAELKLCLAKEYKDRFRLRPSRPDFGNLKERKLEIFQLCLDIVKSKIIRDINKTDLSQALHDLKNKKSRDPHGLINEIFKGDVSGSNLNDSLLLLFNCLKSELYFPDFMKWSNITTIHKKGSVLNLQNQRGVNRVSVVRSIFMKILYNMKYQIVDDNMSDGQMGGRKKKGCRNNIFIINSVIFDVQKSKTAKPVCLQIYDYKQMFDSLSLEQSIIDLYHYGIQDETLHLLYEANKETHISVKTPFGLTERETVKSTVLQGETWASLLASVQVDSISQECMKSGYYYDYKNTLKISILSLVDDCIGMTQANHTSQQLNVCFNVKSAEKLFQFGSSKCKKMFIGKKSDLDLSGTLYVDTWKTRYNSSKANGEILLEETFEGPAPIEEVNEWIYLGFKISNYNNNLSNIRYVKAKSISNIKKILIKLESLNLYSYHFECGILFLKVMLRPSILYASETYFNLTETELRLIERIEESFMRQLLGAPRFYPITQIYLELSVYPARFEIIKQRLLLLHYILNQDKSSTIHQVFILQDANRIKGDWVSLCKESLKILKINYTFTEIKQMSAKQFKNIIKSKIEIEAFSYLLQRVKSKGHQIQYTKFQTSEYLMPNQIIKSIEDKKFLFACRNEVLLTNFNEQKLCICNKQINLIHLYNCEIIYSKTITVEFNKIYNGTLQEMKYIIRRIQENIIKCNLPKNLLRSPFYFKGNG